MLTGFELLAKVESIDKEFESGAPWKGKGDTVIKCGYTREYAEGKLVPQYSEFHEAYEDARIFREIFEEELRESTKDPQELFHAFSDIRNATFYLSEIIEQLRAFGIDYIFELRDEIWEEEAERCLGPVDQ